MRFGRTPEKLSGVYPTMVITLTIIPLLHVLVLSHGLEGHSRLDLALL